MNRRHWDWPTHLLAATMLFSATNLIADSPGDDYLGDYVGQWNSEASTDPYDDISRYDLSESVMRLGRNGGNLELTFFLNAETAAAGEALDLLGFGCKSKVGEMLTLQEHEPAATDQLQTVIDATFDFDWGNCPTRVYAFATNDLRLELAVNPIDLEYVARLSLLHKLQPANQAYLSRDGEKQRVVVRKKEGGTLYHPAHEYCVVNEVGETQACFDRRSEVKHIVVPFPLPGASAVWWTSRDKVEIVEGRRALYHEAVYRRSFDPQMDGPTADSAGSGTPRARNGRTPAPD